MPHDTNQEYATKNDIAELKIDMATMMESMLEKHTLDFKTYVHEGIETVLKAQDERFEELEEKMDKRFDSVDKRFIETEGRMVERFERLEKKIDRGFIGTSKKTLLQRFSGQW